MIDFPENIIVDDLQTIHNVGVRIGTKIQTMMGKYIIEAMRNHIEDSGVYDETYHEMHKCNYKSMAEFLEDQPDYDELLNSMAEAFMSGFITKWPWPLED